MYNRLIKKPEEYFQTLMDIGWVNEWSNENIEILKKVIHSIDEIDERYTAYALSEYSVPIDSVNSSDTYKQFIVNLFKTFNINIPSSKIEVTERCDERVITIETPLSKEKLIFNQKDNVINENIFKFINDYVLPKYGIKRKFYILPPSSIVLEIVFHYPEIIEKAYETGIIPKDNYFEK